MAGTSIRTAESIGKLVKLTASTLSLPASRISIGPMQYVTSAITLNTANVYPTLNGMDSAITSSAIYTVYAVVSSGTVYLIASLNATLPAGFTQARAVGGFNTDTSSQIDQVASTPGDLNVLGTGNFVSGLITPPTQNFLINGNFDIWQRNTTFTASGYCADRWYATIPGGATTVSQITTNLPTGVERGLKWLTSAGNAYAIIAQAIESKNVIPLRGKRVTFSIYVKSTTGNYNSWINLGATYSNSTDVRASVNTAIPGVVYPAAYLTPTSTWQRLFFSLTVPVDAVGLVFNIDSNLTQATGVDLHICQAMLNLGTSAAPFQRAGGTIGGELALCQRYYEKSWDVDVAPGTTGSGYVCPMYVGPLSNSTRAIVHTQVYKVTKRIAPVVSNIGAWNAVGTSGGFGLVTNGKMSIGSGDTTPNTLYTSGTTGFNFRVDDAVACTTCSLQYHWAVDCEL